MSTSFKLFIGISVIVLSSITAIAQQKPVAKSAVKPVVKILAKRPYTQPTDTTISIKANFYTDSVKHLTYYKSQTRYNNKDGTTSSLSTQYEISLKIEERRTNGYLMRWHYDKILPGKGFEKESPFRNAIETFLEGVSIEFSLDTMGNFVKTEYWFSTSDQLTKKVDSLKTIFYHDTLTQPYIDKLYKIVANMDIIEPTVTQLAELYFSCYGKYINQKSGARTSCSIPNIFAGDPFPASGKIKIDTLDRTRKKIVLTWHQGIDTAQARGIFKKALIKQARINGRPIPKDENIPHINVYEDYRLQYNMRNTWFTHIEYTKVTTNGKAGEMDNIKVVLHK